LNALNQTPIEAAVDDKQINYDEVTLQDCIARHEFKHQAAVIENGKITGFSLCN
jgi:hypothetical protein